jgi:hypothetical protein
LTPQGVTLICQVCLYIKKVVILQYYAK